ETLRLAGEEDALVTGGGTALDLPRGRLRIPKRRRADRDEAPRIRRDPLEEEIVVRANAREHQLGVAEPEEGLVPEAADVRVERHRPDADLVHVREARRGVVRRRRRLGEALGR